MDGRADRRIATVGVLERCDGPPCPRCGCQDSKILQWPNDGASWYATGRAECRHCGTRFGFRPARAARRQEDAESTVYPPEIDVQEPAPLSVRPIGLAADPTACPQCGGKGLVYRTVDRQQYRKCGNCGNRFKTLKIRKTAN